jgi:cytochrome b561
MAVSKVITRRARPAAVFYPRGHPTLFASALDQSDLEFLTHMNLNHTSLIFMILTHMASHFEHILNRLRSRSPAGQSAERGMATGQEALHWPVSLACLGMGLTLKLKRWFMTNFNFPGLGSWYNVSRLIGSQGTTKNCPSWQSYSIIREFSSND